MCADFVSPTPSFAPQPDILAAYLRGQNAPILGLSTLLVPCLELWTQPHQAYRHISRPVYLGWLALRSPTSRSSNQHRDSEIGHATTVMSNEVQSKNEPGQSERTIEAPVDPIEPTFLLRGSDPAAYLAVLVWACVQERFRKTLDTETLQAFMTASAMEYWARSHGLDADRMLQAFIQILVDAAPRLQAARVETLPPGQRLQ
jgi:hypothetical protein